MVRVRRVSNGDKCIEAQEERGKDQQHRDQHKRAGQRDPQPPHRSSWVLANYHSVESKDRAHEADQDCQALATAHPDLQQGEREGCCPASTGAHMLT